MLDASHFDPIEAILLDPSATLEDAARYARATLEIEAEEAESTVRDTIPCPAPWP